MPFQTGVSRREKKIVGPLFQRGLPPVGTFLGEDSGLERRIGLNLDLFITDFTLGTHVKSLGHRTGSSDLRSRLVLNDFPDCSMLSFLL